MLMKSGPEHDIREIYQLDLENLRATNLYFDGRSGPLIRLYVGEKPSIRIDLNFYCVFQTKAHYLLLLGNPQVDKYTYVKWEGIIEIDNVIRTAFEIVKDIFPDLPMDEQLFIVSQICKEIYSELTKFDSDVETVHQEDCLTVTVIQDPYLRLEDEEYIEAVCKGQE